MRYIKKALNFIKKNMKKFFKMSINCKAILPTALEIKNFYKIKYKIYNLTWIHLNTIKMICQKNLVKFIMKIPNYMTL